MLMNGKNDISIYIHIPFCSQKCPYCHFYSIPYKAAYQQQLIHGLQIEWSNYKEIFKNKNIVSIYLGGGTPILLGPDGVEQILSLFDINNDIEITLEANPSDISSNEIKSLSKIGINRLSIGIQALSDSLLNILGRTHNSQTAIDAIHTAYDNGISNISIDLMYDIPDQTLKQWETTLKAATNLPIKHISIYNLTLEPHTVFFKKRQKLESLMPNDDTSLKMFQLMQKILLEAGFSQYEISAFAKKQHYSIHNIGYWTGRPFIGLGPSAFSYWEGKRFRNKANLHYYYQNLKNNNSAIDFEEKLPLDDHIREMFIIQLRLIKGFSIDKFKKKEGKLPSSLFQTIQKLIKQGFLESKNGNIKLTDNGILFYDTIATEII